MSQEVPPGLRAQIARLQKLQEELQYVVAAKQQWQLQLSEVESALEELEKLEGGRQVYKIVGTIMVSRDRESLLNELKERKETISLHLDTLKRQEDMLRKQIDELNRKIMSSLGGEKASGGQAA